MFVEKSLKCSKRTKAALEVCLSQPDPLGISCVVALVNNPALTEHLTLAARDVPHTESTYQELLEQEGRDPNRRYWWIWAGTHFVGIIGLYDIKYDGYVGTRSAKLYYLVRKEAQRQGVASAAVDRVVRYAFRELMLGAVGVDVFADHEVGLAFARAVGFKEKFSGPETYPGRDRRMVMHAYIMNPKIKPDED